MQIQTIPKNFKLLINAGNVGRSSAVHQSFMTMCGHIPEKSLSNAVSVGRLSLAKMTGDATRLFILGRSMSARFVGSNLLEPSP